MKNENCNLGTILDGAGPSDTVAVLEVGGDRPDRAVTFGMLDRLVVAAAAGLRAAGLAPGDAVALFAGTTVAHLSLFLGAARAGLVAVPVNVKLGPDGIAHVVRDSGARLAVAEAEYASIVPPGVDTLSAGAVVDGPKADYLEPFHADAHALATIMYTSGATGRPKGVPIRHAGYRWAFETFATLRPLVEGRTGLVAAPLFHMNGQFHLINLLSCGARVVLMRRFTPEGLLTAIDAHDVERATGVPPMYALAAKAHEAGHPADLSRVRMLALGSAPLTQAMLERLQAAFPNAVVTNGYGTTETGPVSFGPHPDGIPTPPAALGHPLPGVEVRLVDGGSANEGRLLLRNRMTLAGYHNLPDVSAARIRDGWYDSGDVMRRDGDGFFFFLGRADDMMQVGGENVYPGEIEKLLEAHPAVAEAAVVPIPDEVKNEKPVAFVVLRPGTAATEDELKAHALANGPSYAHPRRVYLVDALPLSGANKVDKRALRDRALARAQP